ncbi:MAG: PEGA domain-containing protein, partial [Betaproteobacteria bacterium]
RAHEVYAVVGATPGPRRVDEAEFRTEGTPPGAGWLAGTGPLGLRRSALLAAPVVFLLMVAGGGAARALMDRDAPAAKPATKPVAAIARAKPAPAPPADKPAAEAAKPAPQAAAAPAPEAPVKKPAARIEKKVERPAKAPTAGGAGRIEFAVAPWGEVLIDGKSRGVSPPLRTLEIPAGTHTIEIRNSTFPAHVAKVEVKAGEAIKIRHRFR